MNLTLGNMVYDKTHVQYDNTRTTLGIEIILKCLSSNTKPLLDQVILDGGCGTGNYLDALKDKVGGLYGLEFNEQMLRRAKIKFNGDSKIKLRHGDLADLPYEDGMFDGFLCNQVIHHLDKINGFKDFPRNRKMMTEAYRVLSPGGMIIINTSTHLQLQDGFWWAKLIPNAIDKMVSSMPSIEWIIRSLKEVGFKSEDVVVPMHEVLQGDSYLDPEGPLKELYRCGDSAWSMVEEHDLKVALDKVRDMNAYGSIAGFIEEREVLRNRIGQTTFIFARKQGVIDHKADRNFILEQAE